MTPQQKGTLYERLVCERLKARAREDHLYVSGNDVREHHFVQLYKKDTLENRLVARKQLALLQSGKRLRGKNGSVLIGVDLLEVKLPDGVVVVRQLDMKYTEKDVLPFANIDETRMKQKSQFCRIKSIATKIMCDLPNADRKLPRILLCAWGFISEM